MRTESMGEIDHFLAAPTLFNAVKWSVGQQELTSEFIAQAVWMSLSPTVARLSYPDEQTLNSSA